MFEFLASEEDAIAILKKDHETVKKLFDQFEEADSLQEKKKIVADAIKELKIHAEIEEKIFYPAVRKDVDSDLMNEADEEHHVAKLLIAELEQLDATDKYWKAKFTVLSENIRHHIKEEEGDMMPKAREGDIDFKALGKKLLAMKAHLKKNGVPPCDEEKLMKRGGVKADSPAKNAKGKVPLKIIKSPKGKSAKAPAGSYTSSSKGTGPSRKQAPAKKKAKR
jgi:hemerythrin superfamily protein